MKNSISGQKFSNYQDMTKSAKEWDIQCTFKLSSNAMVGEHHVVNLEGMQLSYSKRSGGFMHQAVAPKDALSIAIIQKVEKKACFHTTKLYKGEILFFDDQQAYNFMSKGAIEVAIVSIPKDDPLAKIFSPLQTHTIKDIDNKLSKKLSSILEDFRAQKKELSPKKIANDISTHLLELLEMQTPKLTKLTKGERIALEIRDEVYKHMDGKISIHSLANKHNISEQTLQSAFKSLFGFTPKIFLQLLKLNLVHQDLKSNSNNSLNVSKIASRWGFTHMGRFSSYYSELFGENPSVTFTSEKLQHLSIDQECISRREEIL